MNLIFHMVGNKFGEIDLPCPLCGPSKKSRANQYRRVLRVYRRRIDHLTFYCARCGWRGSAGNGSRNSLDKRAAIRAASHACVSRIRQAMDIWISATSPAGTPVERYLVNRGLNLSERCPGCRRAPLSPAVPVWPRSAAACDDSAHA